MTSVLNVDTIADKAGTGPVGLTKQHAAKAWAHFDCSTPSLDSNFNFSSLTDNGTGDYNPNLTNNMSSVSYACAGSSNHTSSNRGAFRVLTYTTSTVNIRIYGNGSASDASDVSVNFHGDLA